MAGLLSMAQQTICPRCAKRLPPTAGFCRRCGMTQKVSASRASAGRDALGLPPISPAYGPLPSAFPPPPAPPPPSTRPKRPPTRGPSCRGGSWSGGWIIGLMVIFIVRACISSSSHWNSEPHPPPSPHARPYRWTPPPELDEGIKRLHDHGDAFDRRYFPDPPVLPDAPAAPAEPEAPAPPDRPTE